MNKWQCEICGKGFDNFQAQGFDNKIYCPLCYYKKLYQDTELERERLTNIINELEKLLKQDLENENDVFYSNITIKDYIKCILDKLKKLKEGK